MKKIAMVLAILMMVSTLACAAEATKQDKPKTEQNAVQKPEEPKAKAPAKEATLQELQVQRAALALRLEGASAAKQAIERVILDGQVSLSKLDEAIAAKTPKQEPKK